jgi:hypothetical protein
MRAITLLVSGIFLTTVLAASALPFAKPQAGDHAVQVQEKKKDAKKKNEPFKPKEKEGY